MNFFFVFQNKTYDREKKGEYLWAPKGTPAHWKNLRQIKKGDMIFHSYNGNLVAISIATTNCFDSPQPQELLTEKLWENDGWKVMCKYYFVPHPITFSDYKDKILELQPKKYAPFNRTGRGNTGYLFLLNQEISSFFLEQLQVRNAGFVNTIKENII